MQILKMKHLMFGILSTGLIFTSCKKDEENESDMDSTSTSMSSKTFNYEFNNGQTVSSAPYDGNHSDKLTAELKLNEMADGMTEVIVTLNNTVDGETYNIHSHDMADASSTPNGTPYIETPNSDVLVKQVTGNGGSVMVSQMSTMSYDQLTTTYEGFLVVHDPLQAMSTTDISTYLVVAQFARDQDDSGLMSMSYDYSFNTGQVADAYAYSGTHMNNLSAKLSIQELANGQSRVSVALMNTMDGETYPVHAHDQADANNTPNGTPYIEAPNSNVLVTTISGNGGTAMSSQISTKTYTELTTNYDAFFVVHDPLQTMSTTDPTTYVLLGVFAD